MDGACLAARRRRSRFLPVFLVVLGAITALAPGASGQQGAEDNCRPVTVETRRIGGRPVQRVFGSPETVEFTAGMVIDADGAARAYHPDDVSGLDRLAHAGQPGHWWAILTHDGTPNGEPVVQDADDPAPGFYVSTTSLYDPGKPRDDPTRYVDSETVPYLALPERFRHELGCRLGDLGLVTRTAQDGTRLASAAIFADVAPPSAPFGEGSIALADRLGVPSDARAGGTYRPSIEYVLFCGSGSGLPRPIAEIDAEGARLAEARRARDASACPRD